MKKVNLSWVLKAGYITKKEAKSIRTALKSRDNTAFSSSPQISKRKKSVGSSVTRTNNSSIDRARYFKKSRMVKLEEYDSYEAKKYPEPDVDANRLALLVKLRQQNQGLRGELRDVNEQLEDFVVQSKEVVRRERR